MATHIHAIVIRDLVVQTQWPKLRNNELRSTFEQKIEPELLRAKNESHPHEDASRFGKDSIDHSKL